MDSVDLSVLKTLREWQAGGLPLWLATVVETFCSSPRPPGVMLAHFISVRNQFAGAGGADLCVNQV